MGVQDGLCFLALEFIKGPTLKKLIADDAPFPVPRAARLGAGVLSGLGAAHDAGIVHRDLKPGNVLVARGSLVKLVDFGLARVLDDAGQTASGGYVGTPRYASPELARGQDVGPAADQYAMGLIVYEMLTGAFPFSSQTSLGYLQLHAHEPPTSVFDHKANVPPRLGEAVHRALEKDPKDRFPNVQAFERALSVFVQHTARHSRRHLRARPPRRS